MVGCAGGHADSPEEAAKKYFDARHSGNVSALKKVWKVSDDPERTDTIIRAEVAAARAGDRFFRKLRRTYPDEIEEQVMRGDLFVASQEGERPSARDIEEGVENAFRFDESGSRLNTSIRNGGMLSLNTYDGHWYVEHPYVAVGREWTETDRRLKEGTAKVFDEMIDEIGRRGNDLEGVMRLLNRRMSQVAREASRSRLIDELEEDSDAETLVEQTADD